MDLISILVGGGILAFLEFLITRYDRKHEKNNGILDAIRKIDLKITTLEDKIDKVDANRAEDAAIESRVRILRFADEMIEGRRHSKDSFDQAMSDCDRYEKFCDLNKDFKNNQTAATVAYIKKTYAERLEKHDFL